ncbi:MAG: dihydrofolate reductase [Gammaproteobacteria bacterium]|jgi:dihydrofolate reductase|nr:dihydrofolate reductase [Gammaproteobacteria bacterium]MBQ0774985.1 dihydrofolate reductase [Gammaproteobacteria bacterium]|tara:strand:- start:37647 stop:38159 length:513 start_codon:yes stop_codon:yes gene_type:complete
MNVSLIVAKAANGCIGRDNKLPWYLPNDLKYFKQTTFGKPIIMGRKTWESLKGPLPGRANIVITRQENYQAVGAKVVATLDEAIVLAESIALIDGVEEVVIIGGAEIYTHALPRVTTMYVTEVHAEVQGDAFFPDVDLRQWRESRREDFTAEPPNQYDYSFIAYDRVAGV